MLIFNIPFRGSGEGNLLKAEFMILALFVWILFILSVARIHYGIIEIKHTRPNYMMWFVVKVIAVILHATWVNIIHPFDPEDFNTIFKLVTFYTLSWITIFSPVLNALRHKDFWYLGLESGWIDSFFIRHPKLYRMIYLLSAWIALCLTIRMASWK